MNTHSATQGGQGQTEMATPVHADLIDELLSKVNTATGSDEDLPLVGFEDVSEDAENAGKFTSLGFAKIHGGWKCVGYLLGTGIVESDYDSSAGKRKQAVFYLRGTVRAAIANSDAVGEVKGTIKLSQHARLRESLAEVVRAEKRTGRKIPIMIEYIGKGDDTINPDGTKKRTGAHIWKVTQQIVISKKS